MGANNGEKVTNGIWALIVKAERNFEGANVNSQLGIVLFGVWCGLLLCALPSYFQHSLLFFEMTNSKCKITFGNTRSNNLWCGSVVVTFPLHHYCFYISIRLKSEYFEFYKDEKYILI